MNEREKYIKQKSKKRNRKVRVYYSFLTLVLLVCLIQITYSAVLNISKIVSHKTKLHKMLHLQEEANKRNANLKNEINNFGSLKSLEAIARNNLKMASEDEVLVIINDVAEKNTTSKIKSSNFKNSSSKEENNFLYYLRKKQKNQ